MVNFWTEEEDLVLFKYYEDTSCKEISDKYLKSREPKSIRERASRLSLKHDRIKCSARLYNSLLSEIGIIALEEYINSSTPILHRHIECDSIWKASPNSIKNLGSRCPRCVGNRKDHKQYIQQLPINIECLGTYSGAHIKIRHVHSICGYEWDITPSAILRGRGCPACKNKTSDKVYKIYFPELDLYKIGIAKDVHTRIQNLGYKAIVLDVIKCKDSGEAKNLEKLLLSKEKLVNTGKLRSGNTETYQIIDKTKN